MIQIEALLQKTAALDDWKVRRERVESYELFFVHRDLETVRATDTESVTVSVYVDHDGKRGMSSFKLYASTTEAEAEVKIREAAKKAALISDEPYTLPASETLDGVIPSNLSEAAPKVMAAKMAEAVFAADQLDAGSINALEIFLDKCTVSVKNSRGIDKREVKYKAMIEAIPTWNEGESVELYEAIRTGGFDYDAIREEIEAKMREVRDRGRAKPPVERIAAPVVLPAAELSQLFGELAGGLHYARVYSHVNPFSVGDAIQKDPKGDRLQLSMCGRLEGCAASALFDGDGTTLTDTEIIRDGVAASYFGNHRYAQYLKAPATGELSCLSVSPGTLSDEELNAAPYFECVSMSGLQVDVFNDYIGGEVRLAYYFDGEEKHPITGISISGKLSEALSTLRMSDRVTQTGRYLGPKLGLLSGIEIV